MQMQAKQMGTQHTPKTTTLFFSVETRKENADRSSFWNVDGSLFSYYFLYVVNTSSELSGFQNFQILWLSLFTRTETHP